LVLSNNCMAFQPAIRSMTKKNSVVILRNSRPDLHEFDHIFDEGGFFGTEVAASSGVQIKLPVCSGERVVYLASSTAMPTPDSMDEATDSYEQQQEFDPYADFSIQEQEKLLRYEQQQQTTFSQSFENKLKQMDLQDVISTLLLPAIFGGFAVKWGVQRISARVAGKTDATLDSFAKEMVYHDGDFEEMKLCSQDYAKKLAYLGPKKTSAMLKRYLQLYSKKKTVSPQSIR
jgi:hypothetical protein